MRARRSVWVKRARRAAWLVVPGGLCVAAAATCGGVARVTKGDPSDGGPPADATRQDGAGRESLPQAPSLGATPPVDAGDSYGDRFSSVEGRTYPDTDAPFDAASYGISPDALSCARLAACCDSVLRERREPCDWALEAGILLDCEAELTLYQSDGYCSVGGDAGSGLHDDYRAAQTALSRRMNVGIPDHAALYCGNDWLCSPTLGGRPCATRGRAPRAGIGNPRERRWTARRRLGSRVAREVGSSRRSLEQAR